MLGGLSPVNVVNNAQFGQITQTRTVRGDLGSSRQIQLRMNSLFYCSVHEITGQSNFGSSEIGVQLRSSAFIGGQ